MSGYPAHAQAAQILEILNEVVAIASGDIKAKVEKAIEELDPIKDNKTFMRTQKAERITEVVLANSQALKANPADAEKADAVAADISTLAERVKTMVIRMT